ncbi:Uncharacterised protein [Vibrio cholerae]|nr:Uncharacterised protein [Vibrio cholerae]CSI82947.1 Uncharacterised protein [Vibrio cholerae]
MVGKPRCLTAMANPCSRSRDTFSSGSAPTKPTLCTS